MNKYDDAIMLFCAITSLIAGSFASSFEVVKHVSFLHYNFLTMFPLFLVFMGIYIGLMKIIERV